MEVIAVSVVTVVNGVGVGKAGHVAKVARVAEVGDATKIVRGLAQVGTVLRVRVSRSRFTAIYGI